MFNWIYELFFKPNLEEKLEKLNSKICKECGRKYQTSDEAAICSDWDKVLGLYQK